MGDILNKPNDNLVFTSLFKHPNWSKKANPSQIIQKIQIFNNYMKGSLSFNDKIKLLQMAIKNPFLKHHYRLYLKLLFKLPVVILFIFVTI